MGFNETDFKRRIMQLTLLNKILTGRELKLYGMFWVFATKLTESLVFSKQKRKEFIEKKSFVFISVSDAVV